MSVDGSAVDTCVRVHKSIYLSIYLSCLAAGSQRGSTGKKRSQPSRAN